jgi:hypothetical protein
VPSADSIPSRYTILDAVRQTLRSLVVGSPGFTYDLRDVPGAPSTEQRVQLCEASTPPISLREGEACAVVFDGGTQSAPGRALRKFTATGAIIVNAWVPAGPDPEERLQAAALLEVDLKRALYWNPKLATSRNPAGTVHRFVVESETFDGNRLPEAGQHIDMQQMGAVALVISAAWEDYVTDRVDPSEVL